jgi:hypothetical protein
MDPDTVQLYRDRLTDFDRALTALAEHADARGMTKLAGEMLFEDFKDAVYRLADRRQARRWEQEVIQPGPN